MKPVFQTTFGQHGNCYAACLASLLELSIDAVPNLDGDDWAARLRAWLAPQGFDLGFLFGGDAPHGDAISSQRTLDGSLHAVVRRDAEIVHDPSPRAFARPGDPVLLWTLIRSSRP